MIIYLYPRSSCKKIRRYEKLIVFVIGRVVYNYTHNYLTLLINTRMACESRQSRTQLPEDGCRCNVILEALYCKCIMLLAHG